MSDTLESKAQEYGVLAIPVEGRTEGWAFVAPNSNNVMIESRRVCDNKHDALILGMAFVINRVLFGSGQ